MKSRLLVEQPSTSHVATLVKAALLNVPAVPVAPVHAAAGHETSAAAQVGKPLRGGVNCGSAARTESAIPVLVVFLINADALTVKVEDGVGAEMFATLKKAAGGIVTVTFSMMFTTTPVVWLVSGRMTVVCAPAVARPATSARGMQSAGIGFIDARRPPFDS